MSVSVLQPAGNDTNTQEKIYSEIGKQAQLLLSAENGCGVSGGAQNKYLINY